MPHQRTQVRQRNMAGPRQLQPGADQGRIELHRRAPIQLEHQIGLRQRDHLAVQQPAPAPLQHLGKRRQYDLAVVIAEGLYLQLSNARGRLSLGGDRGKGLRNVGVHGTPFSSLYRSRHQISPPVSSFASPTKP